MRLSLQSFYNVLSGGNVFLLLVFNKQAKQLCGLNGKATRVSPHEHFGKEKETLPQEKRCLKAPAPPGAQRGLAPSGAEVVRSTDGSQFGRGCLGKEEGKAPLRAN